MMVAMMVGGPSSETENPQRRTRLREEMVTFFSDMLRFELPLRCTQEWRIWNKAQRRVPGWVYLLAKGNHRSVGTDGFAWGESVKHAIKWA